MSTRMRDAMMQRLAQLRHEPTPKRIRATLGDSIALDSSRAVLVWEPRRIIPSYAVPDDDLRAELVPAAPAPASKVRVLHPGIPFRHHSTEGEPFSIKLGAEVREQAAFRPADADLAGYVLLDFDAFDAWHEEDERVHGHPRDPYHRIDTRASSRHVRVERDGVLLAESTAPVLLFETHLPTRYYLPRADIRAAAEPSALHTYCPYKGRASYLSFGGKDLAWYYPDPLPDAAGIQGLVAFFNEVVDITVDGVREDGAANVFAKIMVDEFGLAT